MKMRIWGCLIYALIILPTRGVTQSIDSTFADTVRLLNEVVVSGFANQRVLKEVPASIGFLDAKSLERFNSTNLLPAVNLVPGVRMEERSPGSYRFSIRGSLLRSPFGIRNVKVYWSGLPLTDGGGNTYLNLIDFDAVGSIEIIKGPGSSLYGAGTGGVIFLTSPGQNKKGLQFSSTFGSFGLQHHRLRYQVGSNKFKASIQYAHQQSDGYREQSAMDRNSIHTNVHYLLGKKSTLSWMSFYSDLFYETPGGLTLTQFESNPALARPGTSFSPGAVENRAAVYNKTFYSALSYDLDWSEKWSTHAGVFVSQTSFDNPSIRNYESRDETNIGGRASTQFDFAKTSYKGKIIAGLEGQYFFSPIGVYDNDLGMKTSVVQSEDELKSLQSLGFIQMELELPRNYYLTAGGSVSFLTYNFKRNNPGPSIAQSKSFNAVFSPRVALLKKINNDLSVFGSVSNGFSPPGLAEVRPSVNTFNSNLNAERGTNFELGFRGNAIDRRLQFDVTWYDFILNQTIVIQRATDGAEFFVNAGKTDQKGLEAQVVYRPKLSNQSNVSDFMLTSSYAYNHYRFVKYVQDGQDYSGNPLTGVPPVIFSLALDLALRKAWYVNVTGSFTDHISLNDLNNIYASSFTLLGLRTGYKAFWSGRVELFVGADNLLNEKYSLGNDLNAFGGRYYNAAPTRNFYAGLKVDLKDIK